MPRPARIAGLAVASLALAGCEPSDSGPTNGVATDNAVASVVQELGPGSYESVFTDLDLAGCATLREAAEGAGRELRCRGYEDVPLFVLDEDGRFDLDAGLENGRWESLGGFNTLGPRVEWRLHGGEPVAVIYRFVTEGRQVLAVETIGRPRGATSPAPAPGCEIARIDAAKADANTLARQRADALAERFQCGVDTPETHGRTD